MQDKPCFNIFSHCLRNIKLCRPFTVISFIICKDTWSVDTGCKLCTVHLLNGLDLEEARACDVGGDDILRQLAVRACSGAERAFDLLAEDGKRLGRVGDPALVHAEDLAGLLPLCEDPVHQAAERNGIHFLRHGIILL